MSNPKHDIIKHSQLCWECEKAGGKCSWSRSFIPVPGWNAKPTRVLSYTMGNGEKVKYYIDSYEIHDCPEFEYMEAIKKNIVKRGRRNDR